MREYRVGSKRFMSFLFFSLLLSLFSLEDSALRAQNTISCINNINLSLDPQSCTATLTPEMVSVGNETCVSGLELTVTNEHGHTISNDFTVDDLGKVFTYMLCCDGNCCWGTVKVESKALPSITCPPADTIPCGTLDYYTFIPEDFQSCSNIIITNLHEEKTHIDCDSLLTAKVDRTYKIQDDFGNETKCHQDIFLARINPQDILWPGTANVSCSDTLLVYDDNGVPFPWYYQPMTGSGTGQGAGIPLLCGVSAPFDFYFPDMAPEPLTGNNYGATVVYNNNNTGGSNGPGFFCPGTGSGTGAYPLIPKGGAVLIVETGDPIVVSNIYIPDDNAPLYCNTQLTYTDIITPSNGLCKTKVIRTWELREWWCTEEVKTTSTQIIQITDDEAPRYTCPSIFEVTTNKDCASEVFLPRLDPVDRCGGDVTIRVQYSGGIVEGDGAKVSLNPGDNDITFVVSDGCNNSSTCNTVVRVVDRTEPVAICEAHKVVGLSSLNENRVAARVFDNGSFDDCGIVKMEARRMDNSCDTLGTVWDEYVRFCCNDVQAGEVMVAFRVLDKSGNQSICMVSVEVQDKLVPDLTCPPDMTIDCREGYDPDNLGLTFGFPQFTGICSNALLPIEVVNADVNSCGIGRLSRTFKIQNNQGLTLESCTQEITVQDGAPLTVIDISWPLDLELNSGCGIQQLDPDLLPDIHSYPTVLGSNSCNILGFKFEDKIISSNVSGFECLVLERTWTVVNWCSQTGNAFDSYVIPQPQLITLRNTVSPVLDNNMIVEYDSHNTDCDESAIIITRTATDDCDNPLSFSYVMRNGSGAVVASGDGATLSGSYSSGLYEVEWTVSDGCGNSDSDIQQVNIYDNTPPTPVCLNGLSAALVGYDSTGDGQIDRQEVELWASDFDGGSYPNCSNPIAFSFTADTTDKLRIYDCTHLGLQEVTLWVTDVNSGAQGFCTTFIDIQAGTELCRLGNVVVVGGEIYTETQHVIQGVEVHLDTVSGMDFTDEQGAYAFANMPLGGDYQITPRWDEDHLNGISTVDIIMIQRHILDIEKIDSPYRLIAADVNNDELINGIDLIELRKLVLGIYEELPENESWRFVEADHVFIDTDNPWAGVIPEVHMITNLSGDENIDFIGVKIGDVDDDVVLDASVGPDNAQSKSLTLITEHTAMAVGQRGNIAFYGESTADIRGWQGTLEFDDNVIDVIEIRSGMMDMDEELNVRIESGFMTVSYDGELPSGEAALWFEIVIEAQESLSTDQDLFNISSSQTRAEAYDADLNVMSVRMETQAQEKVSITSVTPNPFSKEAKLNFVIPESGEVRFEFYDVNGKLLGEKQGVFNAGANTLDLQRADFKTQGFVYLRMLTDQEIIEYRMLVL